jgi:hypothetical protein
VDLECHWTDTLTAADRALFDGIPATSPARTLVDLAAVMVTSDFEDVLDVALVRGVVTRQTLQRRARLLAHPRRRGSAAVLRLLADRHPDVEEARNAWEARMLRLTRALGLPDPVPNHPVVVGGRARKIDLAWPDQRVAVEFDGFVPHSRRRVFDDDRARQNDLVAAGWTVFRFTKPTVTREALAPVVDAVRGQQDRLRMA